MKRYILLSSDNDDKLQDWVNKKMEDGYKCQGGASAYRGHNGVYFLQAMILEDVCKN